MAPRGPRFVAVVVFTAIATAACHGSDHTTTTTRATRPGPSTTVTPSSRPTSTTAPPTSASSSTTSPSTTAPCGPAQQPVTSLSLAPSADSLLLTAVTIRHTARCTDQIVFAFSPTVSETPGVRVSRVSPPFRLAGSGAAVNVAGQRFYQVRFEPASTFDFTSGRPSYDGPSSIVPSGTSHVRQVVNVDSFEGVVTWIVGVGAGDQFAWKASASPPSLTLTF